MQHSGYGLHHKLPGCNGPQGIFDDYPLSPLSELSNSTYTIIVAGGNTINYPGEMGISPANVYRVGGGLNGIISTKGATFMTGDVNNFYLVTSLNRWEYIKLELSDTPDEGVWEYML